MDDLALAKKTMDEEGLALCVVCSGKEIFRSCKIGVLPLYLAYSQGLKFKDCCAADKVVGLGAAFFWSKLNIKSLSTKIISEPAKEYLENNDIEISFEILTNRILDREGVENCPVETLAKNSTSFDEFLIGTKQFLEEKGLI